MSSHTLCRRTRANFLNISNKDNNEVFILYLKNEKQKYSVCMHVEDM